MGIKSTKRILATLIASLVLASAAAAPGSGAPPGPGLPSGEVVCFLEFRHGILVGERCIAFRPIWPDCIKCDAIVIDYGTDIYVHDYLVDGFILLDKAEHAANPANAAAFRKGALDRFMTVAVAVPGEVIKDTGFVDRKSGRFTSEHRQWLVEAGADINVGLSLLRVGGIDPDGDPAIEQGMQHLEEAYEQMANGS